MNSPGKEEREKKPKRIRDPTTPHRVPTGSSFLRDWHQTTQVFFSQTKFSAICSAILNVEVDRVLCKTEQAKRVRVLIA